MPKIIIDLTEEEYQMIKKTINHNGKTDLVNETFSGTEIKTEMTPFGNYLTAKRL